MLCLLTLAFHSCSEEASSTESQTTDPVKDNENSSSILQFVNGTVKNMRTKQPIAGVSIQGSGNNTNSKSNGTFNLSFDPTKPATIIYNKSGFSQLKHGYTNFNAVEEIVIYMEENAIQNQTNKSLSGIISGRDGRITVEVPNVKIEAKFNGGNAVTRSNLRGFYNLSFPSPNPKFDYTYQIISSKKIEIATVTMQSAIKDSSDIDIVFDEVIGGPPAEIDTLITN